MIGEELGSYRVIEPIGKGGMASVYVGEHCVLGHKVAIKVLHHTRPDNPMVERRFVNEAKVVASLRHPGIVEIFDFGRGPGGRAYIVMELLHGETLRTRMRRDGPMPIDQVVVFGRQIAGAVAVAHDAGIIHRDLKPDNIFLVADSEVEFGERIKVLDFGVAKQLDRDKPASEATATGVLIGTPAYMSPEQCKGTGEIDRRSDIYSMGIVLYRMITGELPFESAATGELIGKHLFEVPPVVAELDPAVPAEVSNLIVKCLAKEPVDRYQSMQEVAAELRRISIDVLGRQPLSQVLPIRPPVTDGDRPPSGKGHVEDDEETHPTTLRSATGQLDEATGMLAQTSSHSPWTWPLAIGGALGIGVFLALLIGSSGEQLELPRSGSPGASNEAVERDPPTDSQAQTDDQPEAAAPDDSEGKARETTGAAADQPEPKPEPKPDQSNEEPAGASTDDEVVSNQPAPSTPASKKVEPDRTTRRPAPKPRPQNTRPRPVAPRPDPNKAPDREKVKKPERIPVPTLY